MIPRGVLPQRKKSRGGSIRGGSSIRGSSSKVSPYSKSTSSKQDGSPSFSLVLKIPAVAPFKKPFQEFVIFLQESDKSLFSNPNALAKQYFELDQEAPVINQKTREYYEAILKETNSIKVSHVNLNPGSRNAEIQFSKSFILGALSLQEWGVNPNKPCILNYCRMEYNYWDYVDAWSKAFFYQNSYNTHT